MRDQRLMTLVGCIRGIVLEFDGDARYVNAWADDPALLAQPAEQMLGKTIDDVLGAAGAPFTAMVHRVFTTGTMEHLEYPLDLETGRRWFFADIKRVGTTSTGMTVVFFARDITDRKTTEEALARSEERFRLASLATNDVLWDWDLEHDTVTWNAAAATLLGCPAPVTNLQWWADRIHTDDRAALWEDLERALHGNDAQWCGRYRLRRADGSFGDIVDRGFIIRNDDGRAVRMVGSLMDVTQINRLQAQLLQADRLAALGTLAAGVGHEINNPLTYVIGNLEEVIETVDAVQQELLVDALEGARRIAEIVKSLKVFTHADDRQTRPLDLNEVLEAAIKMADKEIRHRARLVRAFAKVPAIHGNMGQLSQVFLNLLINAAQAIAEGNADRNEIRVTTRIAHGRVEISIEDTGHGIAPDNLTRVFDPFFTTKSVGAGTGLGLSICHGIVEKHGGTIRVASSVGQGSCFTVELPVIVPAILERPRVLVIDDEPQIGALVSRMLRSKADVVALTRARDGLSRLLSDERFDLVLCDLMMPEMTGIELYDELRRQRPDVLRAICFMTGGAFTPRAQEFLASIDSVPLDKPIDRAQLLALLPA